MCAFVPLSASFPFLSCLLVHMVHQQRPNTLHNSTNNNSGNIYGDVDVYDAIQFGSIPSLRQCCRVFTTQSGYHRLPPELVGGFVGGGVAGTGPGGDGGVGGVGGGTGPKQLQVTRCV